MQEDLMKWMLLQTTFGRCLASLAATKQRCSDDKRVGFGERLIGGWGVTRCEYANTMEVGRTEDATGEYPRMRTVSSGHKHVLQGHTCRPATASTDACSQLFTAAATGVAHPSGSRDLRNSHTYFAHAIELYLFCLLRCSHQNYTMHI